MPGNLVDYLFKMVIVGDAGPARENLISKLCYDPFEEDYLATIGAAMYTIPRIIDGTKVKIVAWNIAGQDDFAQLRKAYYQNASLILLTIEDTSPESIVRYKEYLDAIHDMCGKLPISVVVDCHSGIDQNMLDAFVSEMDVSQVVLDSSDKAATQSAIDRMLRELLALNMVNDPYVISFLRSHGIAGDIKSFLRRSNNPLDECKHIDIENMRPFLESEGSSIFLDIDLLAETSLAWYIPQILEQRAEEIKKTWVIKKGKMFDLRYLWLTAYGFEVLRSLRVGLVVSSGELKKIVSIFKRLGFNLKVKSRGFPKSNLTKEMRKFVWNLVEGRMPRGSGPHTI